MARRTIPAPKALEALHGIPFVRRLTYSPAVNPVDRESDGELAFQTPAGPFRLHVGVMRSFLTRSAVSQFRAWARHVAAQPHSVLLLARHIPRPVAEQLIEAQVNFADDAGNIHLVLGDRYNWTVVGKPPQEPASERRPISPAQLQLLVQFVTHPDSMNWPVRRLEAAAGVSKSKAALGRQQLLSEGLLTRKGTRYSLGPRNLWSERIFAGYAQVLRPKLVVGRFRSPEKTPEEFLSRLRADGPSKVRYALSGGPAADLLQHYYRGPEVPVFVDSPSAKTPTKLRLLPDRTGPVSLFRAFGEVVFWEERDGHVIAPPWLAYAELLTSDDLRAQEAARELHKEFLA